MKKTLAALLALFPLLIAPITASAAVNSINGQSGAAQTLATTSAATTTMHMKIVSASNTHTFQWNGTPWTVNQGGTGQTSFSSGALIYGNGTGALATTTAGNLGYVLQFNGTFPTWVSTSSLGVVTAPGGSDGQVQFNDGGVFGGNDGFIYNKNNHEVSIDGNIYGSCGRLDLLFTPWRATSQFSYHWCRLGRD